jgi:hypothetical protein
MMSALSMPRCLNKQPEMRRLRCGESSICDRSEGGWVLADPRCRSRATVVRLANCQSLDRPRIPRS